MTSEDPTDPARKSTDSASSSHMGHRRDRPPAKVHQSRSTSLVGPRRLPRHPACSGGNLVMELPKPIIIDSNRHHPVSTRHDRAGRHGKHRGRTIRELVRRSQCARVASVPLATAAAHVRSDSRSISQGPRVSLFA
jgi:hypothetical protein